MLFHGFFGLLTWIQPRSFELELTEDQLLENVSNGTKTATCSRSTGTTRFDTTTLAFCLHSEPISRKYLQGDKAQRFWTTGETFIDYSSLRFGTINLSHKTDKQSNSQSNPRATKNTTRGERLSPTVSWLVCLSQFMFSGHPAVFTFLGLLFPIVLSS